MKSSVRGASRQYWVAFRTMLLLTVVLGVAYPLAVTGVAQLAMPAQANGSLVTLRGSTIGSTRIGQSFTDEKGVPLPQWFQSRPSSAGEGYDGDASGGSNLGPQNPALVRDIETRREAIESEDGVSAAAIPPDALTASASGLDPHISPAYALLQVRRVAHSRHLAEPRVRALVESKIQGRDLGYLGEPTVNVLQLNMALAELAVRAKD